MNAPDLPQTITIAGIELHHDADVSRGHFWRASDGSIAWLYEPGEKLVAGHYGCTLTVGGMEVGGIAKTVEALDALCRAKIEKTRAALAPTADAWLADCVERAMAAVARVMDLELVPASELRAAFRERFAQPAQCIALVLPHEAAFTSPKMDEDSRRAIPDACDADESDAAPEVA